MNLSDYVEGDCRYEDAVYLHPRDDGYGIGRVVKGQSKKSLFDAYNEFQPFDWSQISKIDDGMLFGKHLWRLTSQERLLSPDHLRLVFLDCVDRERKRFERLKSRFSGLAGDTLKPSREPISEEVRMYVWRRDDGKCVKCSSQDRLEYDHIIPFSKGGSNTERNIQLLCERCNRQKSDSV